MLVNSTQTSQNRAMNKTHLIIACIALIPLAGNAEIYKWVDKDGSTHFSDQAPSGKNVEKLDIKPSDITVMKPNQRASAAANTSSKSTASKTQSKYTSIKITYPTDNLAIRANDGSIKILCNITPSLNTKKRHKIRFYIDGQAISSIGTTCEITLSALNRGSHSVAAEIIDKNGKPLLKSATHTFHLKRVSAL